METSVVLPRRVGLATATALVVGGTVGVGVFLTTASMAAGLASPALLFGVWAFMGSAALCGALCFGELAARHPDAGGSYVYLRAAFGRRVAFLYGWKCLLVMDPGLTATLAAGFGTHVQAIAPAVPAKAAAVAAIVLAAFANVAGVRVAAGMGQGLAIAKVVLIFVLIAGGFSSGSGAAAHFRPFFERRAGAPELVPALAGALVAAFFAFGGWWETSKLAGEIREPRRNLPRALVWGVVIVTALYAAVSAAYVYLVPLQAGVSDDAFAIRMGEALFGSGGGKALSAIIALFALGSLFAFMTVAPRLYYAMARDGVMPAFAGRLHPGTGAPVNAILIQAALAIFLVLVGSLDAVLVYFVFATVAFLSLTVLGLFRLRRRVPDSEYRTPWFPATPLLFLASTTIVLVLLGAGRPQQAALGTLVVALGLPAYHFLRRGADA